MGIVGSTPSELVWRKSSRSGGAGACVEVAGSYGAVHVRDSKDRSGPVLTFTDAQWREFIVWVKE